MGGLRLFREASASSQTIKMNVGTGGGESWNDGGNLPVDGNWVHVGVTVSPTESKIYFNGVLQRTATYTTFDFFFKFYNHDRFWSAFIYILESLVRP